jgi:gliding motility-associated-like protein
MDYCIDDTLQLDLSTHDSITNMFLKFDNTESIIGNSSDVIWLALKDNGTHTICLRSERLSCTDSLCQNFNVFPPPQIPIIDCFATDSSILFNWSFHADETYMIDVLQGGNYIRLSDTTAFFDNLKRGEYIKIKVRATNPYCPEQISELECQSKTCPPIQVDIVQLDTICLDGVMKPFLLNATTNPNQTNGIWNWKGPGVVDSLTGLFDAQLAGPGNHRIFSVLDQNGCKYFANSTIVIRENPISNFSLDSVVCQDSTINISFKGSRADSASFNWNFDGGNFKFINANRDLQIKWNTPGKKFLKLKLNNYRCFDESIKSIDVLEPLTKPAVNCETTDSLIIFKWNSNKRVKKFKIAILNGNTGQFIDDTTYAIRKRFFNDSATIQLTLEDNGPCSDISGNIESCKSPDCPPRNLLADTTLNYCFTNPKTVQLNQFIKDPIKQFNWSGDSILNNSINTVKLKLGKYQYIIHGNDFGCMYNDTLNININPSPEILSFDVQKIPCDPLNRKGSIRFNQVLSTQLPILYSVDGISFQSNPEFQNLPSGNYFLFAKDALGCIGDTVFELIEPEIPDIDLGPDIRVSKGTKVNLSALISGSYKIIDWSSSENLSCYSCTTPSLIPKETLTITCLITNEDGCTSIDSITINVFENKVFAPNAFSPNGDNVNDIFTFYGTAKLIRSLEIFDRWGNKVFSKQDFLPNGLDHGWSGRFNDQACMPGVYVYYGIVQFDDGEELILKGDVTLIK